MAVYRPAGYARLPRNLGNLLLLGPFIGGEFSTVTGLKGRKDTHKNHGELHEGVFKAYVRSLHGNSSPAIALDAGETLRIITKNSYIYGFRLKV